MQTQYMYENKLISVNYLTMLKFAPAVNSTCLLLRRSPRPKSSTPALLLTMVRSFCPIFSKPWMRFSGIPHSPKPVKISNL